MKSLTPGSLDEELFVRVFGKPVTMDTSSSFPLDDRFDRFPLKAPSFSSNSSSVSSLAVSSSSCVCRCFRVCVCVRRCCCCLIVFWKKRSSYDSRTRRLNIRRLNHRRLALFLNVVVSVVALFALSFSLIDLINQDIYIHAGLRGESPRKKKMTWRHFRVLKTGAFLIRVEKRATTRPRRNSAAFSVRVRARENSDHEREISNDRYVLALRERKNCC